MKMVVNAPEVDASYAQVASRSKPNILCTMRKGSRPTPDGLIKRQGRVRSKAKTDVKIFASSLALDTISQKFCERDF